MNYFSKEFFVSVVRLWLMVWLPGVQEARLSMCQAKHLSVPSEITPYTVRKITSWVWFSSLSITFTCFICQVIAVLFIHVQKIVKSFVYIVLLQYCVFKIFVLFKFLHRLRDLPFRCLVSFYFFVRCLQSSTGHAHKNDGSRVWSP